VERGIVENARFVGEGGMGMCRLGKDSKVKRCTAFDAYSLASRCFRVSSNLSSKIAGVESCVRCMKERTVFGLTSCR